MGRDERDLGKAIAELSSVIYCGTWNCEMGQKFLADAKLLRRISTIEKQIDALKNNLRPDLLPKSGTGQNITRPEELPV